MIAQHQCGPAFKTYPRPTFHEARWTALGKPVARSTVEHVELRYRWEAAPVMWRRKPPVEGSCS